MTALTLDKETIAAEAADWVARAEELVESLPTASSVSALQAKRLRKAAATIDWRTRSMSDAEAIAAARAEASMFRNAAALLEGSPDTLLSLQERLEGMSRSLEKEKSAPAPLFAKLVEDVDETESWMKNTVAAASRRKDARSPAERIDWLLWYGDETRKRAKSAVEKLGDIYAQIPDEALRREAEDLAARAVHYAEAAVTSSVKACEDIRKSISPGG